MPKIKIKRQRAKQIKNSFLFKSLPDEEAPFIKGVV